MIFYFKRKTAYDLRISDWSSDVCSSDLSTSPAAIPPAGLRRTAPPRIDAPRSDGSPGHAPAGPAPGPGLHILVAEDVALHAEMLQAMLEHRGRSVRAVSHGRREVRAVRTGVFDIVHRYVEWTGRTGLSAAHPTHPTP